MNKTWGMFEENENICLACNGTGEGASEWETCPSCNGTGERQETTDRFTEPEYFHEWGC
jgi:DnaJ-class molecular chaperone